MNETLRSFIAIELDKSIQTHLHDVQEDMQRHIPDIRWVKPGNIHLTLKFLGEVSLPILQSIKEQLPSYVEKIRPFDFTLDTVGAFPRTKHPRVIWVGVSKDNSLLLSELAAEVEQGLKPLGFKKEKRPFTAHITIGRVRSTNHIFPAETISRVQIPPGLKQPVKMITLFKSTLTPQGPIYEALSNAPLTL